MMLFLSIVLFLWAVAFVLGAIVLAVFGLLEWRRQKRLGEEVRRYIAALSIWETIELPRHYFLAPDPPSRPTIARN